MSNVRKGFIGKRVNHNICVCVLERSGITGTIEYWRSTWEVNFYSLSAHPINCAKNFTFMKKKQFILEKRNTFLSCLPRLR